MCLYECVYPHGVFFTAHASLDVSPLPFHCPQLLLESLEALLLSRTFDGFTDSLTARLDSKVEASAGIASGEDVLARQGEAVHGLEDALQSFMETVDTKLAAAEQARKQVWRPSPWPLLIVRLCGCVAGGRRTCFSGICHAQLNARVGMSL